MIFIIFAALGAGISELLNVVVAVAERTQNFESNLGSLRKTLESVEPIFNEAEKLGILFNRPKEEIHQFKDQVNRGVDVVCKCSNIPDWKKHSYSKKLIELDTSILKFFQIEVQGLMLVNTISLDDQYAMTVSCQPAVPKGGCSRIPDALVKVKYYNFLNVEKKTLLRLAYVKLYDTFTYIFTEYSYHSSSNIHGCCKEFTNYDLSMMSFCFYGLAATQ